MEATQKRQKKLNRIKLKDNVWGWLFILLPVIGTVSFVFIPAVRTLYASFTTWSGTTPLTQAKLAGSGGFANYIRLFGDEHFWSTLGNTVYYMIGIPINIVISLSLALLMNRPIRFKSTFRVIYYIPVVASVVSVTLLFNRLFDVGGVVNAFLGIFGIEPVLWNASASNMKISLLVLLVWKNLGGNIILFIAALQGVNRTYYEAARIDGAGMFRIFFRITLPQLWNVIFFILVTSFIGGAQIYTEPALFYPNSSADWHVQPLVTYLQYVNTQRQSGLSAAVAMVLAVMIFGMVVLQFALNSRRERENAA